MALVATLDNNHNIIIYNLRAMFLYDKVHREDDEDTKHDA